MKGKLFCEQDHLEIDLNPVINVLCLLLCQVVGNGSRSHDLFGDDIISFLTSSTVAGSTN